MAVAQGLIPLWPVLKFAHRPKREGSRSFAPWCLNALYGVA